MKRRLIEVLDSPTLPISVDDHPRYVICILPRTP